MSMVHERIKIGVENEGQVKLIDNLNLDSLSYDLVDEGGEEFAAEMLRLLNVCHDAANK